MPRDRRFPPPAHWSEAESNFENRPKCDVECELLLRIAWFPLAFPPGACAMIRILSFLAVLAAAAAVPAVTQGAELKKLVVKCIEKAEATPDDVFLEFEVDGKILPFGKHQLPGTSRENTVNMTDGSTYTLDQKILDELKFEKSLVIRIKDKDITRNEPIGEMKLAPGDVSNTYVSKGKDVGAYEYHVDYTTTK
jgi:hypothetical protein